MAISKRHKNVIELTEYRRKRVAYYIDPGPVPQPEEPGYLRTYAPPAPYGPQEEEKITASDKTHNRSRTLETSREMARKTYVMQMREIIEEMRNTQKPTLDGLKEIVRKRTYARRMRDLRIERIDEIQRLEREGGASTEAE